MPNPLLWGAVAGVLNFIPYVGSLTTLVLLTVVAFVTFSSAGHAALVTASYLVIATIEGQLVQPLVVGRRLDLNPIMVFLALWFAGWFWGVAGIVMAVPALVSLKVVAANSAHGAPLMEFLSPNKLMLKPLRRARSVEAPPAQALPKRPSTAKGG
jgi:predicted PurR-regulated permease PerM